jgi:lysophospholipase L1-like esterase
MKTSGFSPSLITRAFLFGFGTLLAASAGLAVAAQAEIDLAALPAAQARWQSSLAAFAASDRERLPASGGVLFVGSSTIRLWTSLAQDFRQLPVVINRGFCGSTMADCDYFARQLVTRYKPKEVLVYAGDNDLAEGRTAQQVLQSFTHFVQVVRSELPEVRIAYISIKPSPLRAALIPRIREANSLLSAYVRTLENAEYIDVFSAMLGPDGLPRAELFRGDQLHMNDAGYALWQKLIGSRLPLPAVAPESKAAPASPAVRPAVVSTTPLTAAAALPLRPMRAAEPR